MIVITSDRGLCGAYNANIIKMARIAIQENYPDLLKTGEGYIWPIGKKAYEYFTKAKYEVDPSYKDIFLNLNFEHVQAVAQEAIKAFLTREYDR
jgi:F-type H+-transporting ATPase subunit gamma